MFSSSSAAVSAFTPVTARTNPRLPPEILAHFEYVTDLPPAGQSTPRWLLAHRQTGEKAVLTRCGAGVQPVREKLAEVLERVPQVAVRRAEPVEFRGRWFELSEYLPLGSLRETMQAQPARLSFVRDCLRELSRLLGELHGAGQHHARLNPERILLRGWYPLSLALDEFDSPVGGIGRDDEMPPPEPLHYAAPETAMGQTGPAADFWSLGMILVELITGTHPFAGIPENQIFPRLLTGPIELDGISHELWRALCGGLLIRNPAKRWGGKEIAAWLQGEVAAIDAEPESGFDIPVSELSFRVGDTLCFTAPALVSALSRKGETSGSAIDWPGIAAWLRDRLGDPELAGLADRMAGDTGLSTERRLLSFRAAVLPDEEMTWRGIPLNREALLALAVRAVRGDGSALELVEDLHRLAILPVVPALESVDREWREQFGLFGGAFSQSGQGGGFPSEHRPLDSVILPVMLAQLLSSDFAAHLRRRALQAATPAARESAWFKTCPPPAKALPYQVLLWLHLGPIAERQQRPAPKPRGNIEPSKHNDPPLLPLLANISLLAAAFCAYWVVVLRF